MTYLLQSCDQGGGVLPSWGRELCMGADVLVQFTACEKTPLFRECSRVQECQGYSFLQPLRMGLDSTQPAQVPGSCLYSCPMGVLCTSISNEQPPNTLCHVVGTWAKQILCDMSRQGSKIPPLQSKSLITLLLTVIAAQTTQMRRAAEIQ